jgi:hypothetical protein
MTGVVAVVIVAAGPQLSGQVQSDPIRCWWKTDASAVSVGEQFMLLLTCAVIETPSVTVTASVEPLDPGALSIAPFEVVSGRRLDDVVAAPWRYLQFEYRVRLLSEGFFGQDVAIPPLTVTYNVKAPDGSGQGRDLGYQLPSLPLRIVSLVPRSAADIRDTSAETFAAVETRRFRSAAALVAGGICFAFAAVFVLLGLVQAVRRFRPKETAVRPLPAPSLLRACSRTLSDIRAEARGGWTPPLVRRALAALRVAAAVAAGRRVSQDFVRNGVAEREGQLAVRAGFLRPRRAVVSASMTPSAVADGPLGEALRVFSAARYGRNSDVDGAALDAALAGSSGEVRRLHVRALWPMRVATSVARVFTGF